jgi:hypothetical protein
MNTMACPTLPAIAFAAAASCALRCRAHGVVLGPELEVAVADVVPVMEWSKVTRGKGGEVMRSAICRRVICFLARWLPRLRLLVSGGLHLYLAGTAWDSPVKHPLPLRLRGSPHDAAFQARA